MTSIDTELRALSAAAAPDISAPCGLSSRVLKRLAHQRRRRRLAGISAVAVLAVGGTLGATRLGASPYFTEIQPSQAMDPAISQGEHVTFNRDLTAVTGDVVRLRLPQAGMATLSRVVAEGGHTVGCPAQPDGTCTGVRVDGKLVSDPYLAGLVTMPFGDVAVPTGDVFVLGDNRANAVDSRVVGPVAASDIEAVAVAITQAGGVVAIPGAPRHDVPGDSDVIDPPDPRPSSGASDPR